MIILISGASHTGKTLLAQKLLEKYHYPYLSIDHLKMGLIRSKNTNLTPESDDRELTDYLWPIICEMIKTAVENDQNMIIEGCYIPFDWQNHFTKEYAKHIRYICLIMTEEYINNHFEDIKRHENDIEQRLYDDINKDELISDNKMYLEGCLKHNLRYILINDLYEIDITAI